MFFTLFVEHQKWQWYSGLD